MNLDIELVIIDSDDSHILKDYKWYILRRRRTNYVVRYEYIGRRRGKDGKSKSSYKMIPLHRYLMGLTTENLCVDHINGNGLDNRRENLRICDRISNSRNRSVGSNNTTGYKGVYELKGRYQSAIRVNKKKIHLGCFDNPIEAAKEYDKAATRYFGEFAKVNFICI